MTENKKSRKPGYYWVKSHDMWVIFPFCEQGWVIKADVFYQDTDWQEINEERIIAPDEK